MGAAGRGFDADAYEYATEHGTFGRTWFPCNDERQGRMFDVGDGASFGDMPATFVPVASRKQIERVVMERAAEVSLAGFVPRDCRASEDAVGPDWSLVAHDDDEHVRRIGYSVALVPDPQFLPVRKCRECGACTATMEPIACPSCGEPPTRGIRST